MSDFIINPSSVSFKQIREDLFNYLNSKPDIAQWSLFLQSNAGSNMLDIVAGLGAFAKMEAIINRREGFTQFAQNRSSIIGHSQGLGYSAYRGKNKVLKITIIPEITEVIPKYTYLGVVRDRYIITESDVVVNAGIENTFNVIVGEVFEETKISPSANLNVFRYKTPNVSQDCRIFIDDQEIEFTDSVEGMLSGKFFLQSNPYGSVDAKFLNMGTFLIRYSTGSKIKLQWIDLKDVDFDDSEVSLYEEYGTLTGITTVSAFADVEESSSIAVNAPLKNETGNAVRGREDQVKIYKTLHPDILDAEGEDVSSAIMKIFILRNNGIAFTANEKVSIQETFEPKRPHGLLPPIVEDADAAPLTLNISITLKKNATTLPQVLVDGIIDEYRNKLGVTVNLPDIESAIEEDIGVKIARVSVASTVWSPETYYRLGQYVRKAIDNGMVYRVFAFNNASGNVEPIWPIEAKAEITDFELIWRAVPKSDIAGFQNWSPEAFYKIGDRVKPSVVNDFIYECVDVLFYSGNTEPTWPTTNLSEIYDNRLIWKARPIEGTVSPWEPNTSYKKGDVVTVTVSEEPITMMYQCVGYLGKSGLTAPDFLMVNGAIFNDFENTWQVQEPTQNEHTVAKNQYYVITTNLTVK